MFSSLLIRAFEESDRPRLQELFLVARRAAFPWIDSGSFYLHDFDEATAGEVIYVAELGEKVVGFASVWKEDNFLHNLFVDPGHWRKGIGLELLKASVREIGRPARLKCLVHNANALAFYQAHGWQIVETGSDPLGEYYVMCLFR